MRAATLRASQCPFTDYAGDVAKVDRTTQHTIGVDDELWRDCMAIAKVRRERVSQVVRRKLVEYRQENSTLLDEIKRAAATDDT